MTAISDLVLTTLDQLVARALTGQPARTDGKALNPNVVYSQLPTARMVDPRDFANPWSPMGGSTLQEAAEAKGATPVDPDDADAAAGNPPPDPRFRKAMSAAFRTSELVDTMMMVTNDGTHRPYAGAGRKLSFAYENIINAMQPVPAPPLPADLQARIDQARAVLYELDEEGEILGPSDRYRRYQKNARAYAQAKADFATQQALVLADSSRADIWPMLAAPLQRAVDDAWDNFKTAGTEKVEQALDTIESVGQSLGARMIARSRELLEAWKLNLAGVPTQTVYSYVDPTRWYDAEEDIGWTRFTVTQQEANTHTQSNTNSWASSYYRNHSESTGGGGGLSLGFFVLGGEGGSSSSESTSGSSSGSTSTTQFHNDASGLTIEIEWGLCDIVRPAVIPDLFHLQNWYMVGQKEHCISDGTVEGQVNSPEPLLPMIPLQFLVIRNVKITASQWNQDGQTLKQLYTDASARSESSSGHVQGAAGLSLGFFSIGGSAGHDWSDSSGNWWTSSSGSESSDMGWKFDGSTLEIKGSQIVGWVSHVLPPCPPLPDPGLESPDGDDDGQ